MKNVINGSSNSSPIQIKNNSASISQYFHNDWLFGNTHKSYPVKRLSETSPIAIDRDKNTYVRIGEKNWILSPASIGNGSFATVGIALPVSSIGKPFHQLLKDKELMVYKRYKSVNDFEKYFGANQTFQTIYRQDYPEYLQDQPLESLYTVDKFYKKAYLLMPLFPGSLKDIHQAWMKKSPSSEGRKYYSFICGLTSIIAVCKAMQHFHQSGFAHMDIKIPNIQYDELLEKASVIDPDFALHVDEQEDKNTVGNTVAGSPVYLAPELLHRGRYGYKSDYYALAAVILQLLGNTRDEIISTKLTSYEKANSYRLLALTKAGYDIKLKHLENHLSHEQIRTIKDHLESLSAFDPVKRPDSLDSTIALFQSLRDQLLDDYQADHKDKMKDALNELTQRPGVV